MAKYLQGMRTTSNINQDRRVRDVSGKIFYLNRTLNPLVLLLQKGNKTKDQSGKTIIKFNKRGVKNPKYEHYENSYKDVSAVLTTGYSSGVTISVPDASLFVTNDILYNVQKDEYMRVDSSNVQTNVITVERDYIGGYSSNPPAGDVGDTLLNVGNAFAEGSGKPTAISSKPEAGFNYVQDFRHGINLSDIEAGEDLYGEDEETRLLKEIRIEHVRAIERAFMFGERSVISDPVTGKRVTTTRGLLKSIQTYNTDIPLANFNAKNFEAFLNDEALMYKMPETARTKICLAGNGFLTELDGFAKEPYYSTNLTAGENTLGIFCSKYSTRKGQIKIIEHPYLTDYYTNTAIIIDLNAMYYVYFKSKKKGSLDTKLHEHVQANDVTAIESYLRTVAGFQMVNEATCARINIT